MKEWYDLQDQVRYTNEVCCVGDLWNNKETERKNNERKQAFPIANVREDFMQLDRRQKCNDEVVISN